MTIFIGSIGLIISILNAFYNLFISRRKRLQLFGEIKTSEETYKNPSKIIYYITNIGNVPINIRNVEIKDLDGNNIDCDMHLGSDEYSIYSEIKPGSVLIVTVKDINYITAHNKCKSSLDYVDYVISNVLTRISNKSYRKEYIEFIITINCKLTTGEEFMNRFQIKKDFCDIYYNGSPLLDHVTRIRKYAFMD